MSVEERIASGFRLEAVADVSNVVSGAILIILLARLLDPDRYGLLYFALSIMAVGTLISSLGFGHSAARYISEYDEKEAGQIPHVIETSALYTFISLVIVSVTLVLFYTETTALLGDAGLEPVLLFVVLFLIGGTTMK